MPIFPEPLRGQTSVSVRFAWTGDPAVGEEMIRAIRSVAGPLIDTVQTMPYSALGDVHSDPIDPMPLFEHHSLLYSFGRDGADRLLELAGPDAQCAQAMVEVRQLGGKVRDDRGLPSAFAHRDAAYSLFTIGVLIPEIAEVVTRDTARVHDGLSPWTRAGGLPNFTDTAGPQWAQRVFTPEVARRLETISRVFDPDAVLLAAAGSGPDAVGSGSCGSRGYGVGVTEGDEVGAGVTVNEIDTSALSVNCAEVDPTCGLSSAATASATATPSRTRPPRSTDQKLRRGRSVEEELIEPPVRAGRARAHRLRTAVPPRVARASSSSVSECEQRRDEHRRASLRGSCPLQHPAPPLVHAELHAADPADRRRVHVGLAVGVALGDHVELGARLPSGPTSGTIRPSGASCRSGSARRATIRCVTSWVDSPVGKNEMIWPTLRSDSSEIARSTTASPASNFGAMEPDVTMSRRWWCSWYQRGTARDVA